MKERISIDRDQATILIFPEPVQLALTSLSLELNSMSEGDASKIWKASPKCEKKCEDIDLEFITVSNKHMPLLLKAEVNIKDHVLTLNEAPTIGSLEGTRQRLPQLAREAFMRVVRGWPPYPKSEEPTPEPLIKFAEKWDTFKSDQFLIYVGTSIKGTRNDIESLQNSSMVLVGTYDNLIVIICRRHP